MHCCNIVLFQDAPKELTSMIRGEIQPKDWALDSFRHMCINTNAMCQADVSDGCCKAAST